MSLSVTVTATPAVSSSVTVTATPAMVTASYASALLAATTAWVMDAASFTASASSAADTLTVCAVLQLAGEKVKVAGDTVTSGLPLLVTPITTLEAGCTSRTTV